MEKTYLQEVGERLIQCRTRNFFSRQELAKRAGVPISSIRKMENGEEAIGIEDAKKICEELDCSTEYILTGNCGFKEFVRLSQKLLNLPDVHSGNLQKVAQAFWQTCPKIFR